MPYIVKLKSFHSQTIPTHTYEERSFASEEEARKFIKENMGKSKQETFWGESAGREEVVGWELSILEKGWLQTIIDRHEN